MTPSEIESMVVSLTEKAKQAALDLATIPTDTKNATLESLAHLLESNVEAILRENNRDMEAGRFNGLSGALLDRLELSPARIAAQAESIRQVADLEDPVGEVIDQSERPNGLRIHRVRVPIGVIGIIYESRPLVTVDCASLCLKSGNASILRGGKEAFYSNTILASLIRAALTANTAPADGAQFIPTPDRLALNALLKQSDNVDCIIPRGGEGLIRFVAENALMPVIKHYKGVCNVYIDRAARAELAQEIVVNAKTQRPGVCNAAENLFMHEAIAPDMLPGIAEALIHKGVELRVDEPSEAILAKTNGLSRNPSTEADYYEEYLDLILSVKIVPDLDRAIEAVNTYGSGHSDAIVTEDEEAARAFLSKVDSATVYWNASTRFTDGFQFGLGAEIGISTDKLHARGPMGLRELTTYKYLIYGNGQLV